MANGEVKEKVVALHSACMNYAMKRMKIGMKNVERLLMGILVFVFATLVGISDADGERAPWDCSECGRTGIIKNFCGTCAHPAPWMKEAFQTIGNIVRFGLYEQDNNLDNGPEEIEWIVLDVQQEKSLLLSKYGLDAICYNTEKTNVTWETCTLRSWLNSEFLKKAFTMQEQSAILSTKVDNSKNQG